LLKFAGMFGEFVWNEPPTASASSMQRLERLWAGLAPTRLRSLDERDSARPEVVQHREPWRAKRSRLISPWSSSPRADTGSILNPAIHAGNELSEGAMHMESSNAER
jgi:hypothetical protein